MDAAITAAWVQAAPVWVAGIVALVTLGNWKKQQRGQRQLEHVERALVSGREMFWLVRSVIYRTQEFILVTDTEDDEIDDVAIKQRLPQIKAAQDSLRIFQANYALAAYYVGSPEFDIGDHVSELIFDISNTSQVISYEIKSFCEEVVIGEDGEETNLGTKEPEKWICANYSKEDAREIVRRIKAAELALIGQLSPVLSPPAMQVRLASTVGKTIKKATAWWPRNEESR